MCGELICGKLNNYNNNGLNNNGHTIIIARTNWFKKKLLII